MNYHDLFKNKEGIPAKERIIIVGLNPIIQELTDEPEFISDLLRVNDELKITFIYESETENFNQSLFYQKGVTKRKLDFDKLQTYRNRLLGGKKGQNKKTAGLVEEILSEFQESERSQVEKRIKMFQNNLRHFVNLIVVDGIIWYCFTTLELPTVDMYQSISKETNSKLYSQFEQYIGFLLNKESGGIYLSKPGDELIQLYDMKDYPRGIYPRKAFYSTSYQRYSVWAFIFNRKGQLLLQQRSQITADNRSLWDKSAGGHVDLVDSSTVVTAKRELVEELFLPEAEFTKYMKAETGDIIDFGEWNIVKRSEKHLKAGFDGLDTSDWVVFRATDQDGQPMTIQRKSPRIMHVQDVDNNGNLIEERDEEGNCIKNEKGKPKYKEHKETWYTRFISDVFLFVAPKTYLDSEESMADLMAAAEKQGAQSAHKLVDIEDLIEDIDLNPEIYTDDMVYMCSEQKWLLVQFAESIKYIFKDEL